jgi:Spy/CpxP family protein refolding chaperone
MKTSVFALMVIAATTMLSVTVLGQQRGIPQGGERFVQAGNDFQELKLTDDQMAKLKKLHKDFAVQDSVAFAKLRAERKDLMEKRMKSYESILTPEQLEKFKKAHENNVLEGRHGEHRGFGREGFGSDRGFISKQGFGPGRGLGQRSDSGSRRGLDSRGEFGQKHDFAQKKGMATQGFGSQRQGEAPQGFGSQQRQSMAPRQGFGAQSAIAQKGLGKKGFKRSEARNSDRGFAMNNESFDRERNSDMRQGLESTPDRRNNSRNQFAINPVERIDKEVQDMTKQLQLSSDQAKKIKDIRMKYAKDEIKRYNKMQKKLDARKKKTEAPLNEIKSVLNEEQLKKLEASKIETPYTSLELSFQLSDSSVEDLTFY